MREETHAPWYKQTWLWFVLAPLIATVIYGFLFLYLSIVTNDGVVKDDFYKVARGISADPSREEQALKMGIQGRLTLDSLTGDVQLQLASREQLPPQLQLNLVHPTHQKYDQALQLRSVDNRGLYSSNLQGKIEGKRYVIIEPFDKSWQIRTETTPPYDHKTFDLGAAK
ncbi:FixH family protein [Marinobacterium sp. YM272]|uniref:FixH family protein n=1 Tax=Marinobacterium sp. YM272 TaxID=3421654 RepID=UPI003D7F5932